MDRLRSLRPEDRALAAGVVLVAVYAILRTAGAADQVVLAWTALAVAAMVAWPLTGLVVLAALGPFTEAQTGDGRITAVPFLLAGLGASVVLHVAVRRRLPRPSVPVLLAGVLFVATALGVLVSALRYGTELGLFAAQGWVPGIGGALTVLIASWWLAVRGQHRALYVAVAAIAIGALVSMINELSDQSVRASAIGWLLRADVDPHRVGGLFPAPNAVAALFVTGIAVCLALAVNVESTRVRLLATAGTAVQMIALAMTFSRSGLVALGVVVAIVIWRRWPRAGPLMAVAVVGVTLAAIGFVWLERDIPIATDQSRLTAWQATIRLWLDHPLFGAGFRSFEWLHAEYGSAFVNAPHNEWLRLFSEEGTLAGLAGLAFAVSTLVVLLRGQGTLAVATGTAAVGLFLAACFNNPFLSVQLNVPAFLIVGTGLGLVQAQSGRSAAFLGENHGNRAQQDLEIHPERPSVDVVEVQLHAPVEVRLAAR